MVLSRIVLVGLGRPENIDALGIERFAAKALRHISHSGEKALTLLIDNVWGAKINPAAAAAHAAYGASLAGYRFDKYRTTQKPEDKPSIDRIEIGVKGAAAARRAYQPLAKVAEAIFFARDIVTEPANVIYPVSLARE